MQVQTLNFFFTSIHAWLVKLLKGQTHATLYDGQTYGVKDPRQT